MHRFRDWLRQRQEDRQPAAPLRRFHGSEVAGRTVSRVLWDGPSGATLLAQDGALIKVWMDGARDPEDRDFLQQVLTRHRTPADGEVRVSEDGVVGDDLYAVQPEVSVVLPLDPTLARFRADDTDNRLELAEAILMVLSRVESAGRLPRHFTSLQLCYDTQRILRFDALGPPYPPPHLHRLLQRKHHLDELHLRPWPAPAELLSEADAPAAATAVWCAGHLMFELLTGQAPFGSTDATLSGMAMLLEGPPSPRAANSQVPLEISRLVSRMLAANPHHRPASLKLCYDTWVSR